MSTEELRAENNDLRQRNAHLEAEVKNLTVQLKAPPAPSGLGAQQSTLAVPGLPLHPEHEGVAGAGEVPAKPHSPEAQQLARVALGLGPRPGDTGTAGTGPGASELGGSFSAAAPGAPGTPGRPATGASGGSCGLGGLGGRGAVRGGSWHARVCRGDLQGLTRAEVEELFQAVDAGHDGAVGVLELRLTVAKSCPEATQALEEALSVAGAPDNGRVSAEDFLQASRLGAPDDIQDLAARLRGRDPLEAAGRMRRAPLVAYLKGRKEMRSNCLSLPFTLGFFALFFGLALWHFPQQEAFRLTEAVALDLPLEQLANAYPSSLWAWLEGRAEMPRLAWYNLLVGGIHLAKASSGESLEAVRTLCPCTVAHYVAGLCNNGATVPAMCPTADSGSANGAQWLLWPLQRQNTSTTLAEVRSWWQVGTSVASSNPIPISSPEQVEVSMLAHNANLNFFVLYRLRYNTAVSGAPVLGKKAVAFDAAPLWLNASEDWDRGGARASVMFFDVVFLVMSLILLISELWRMVRLCCCLRCKRCGSCCSIWSLVDWVIVLMAAFLTLMYIYCNHLTRGLLELIDALPAVNQTQRYTLGALQQLVLESKQLSWADYLRQLDATVEQAALVGQGRDDLRWYATVFAAALGLRFFRAFRSNPRLNVVLQTLKRSASDFAHFLVVFVFLLLAFALIGHAIFGGNVQLFSTAGGAIHSTFLLLLGFLFDSYKDEMFESGGALVVLWTVAFNFIMVLLLLNVITAIIFDTYTEVKMATGDAPTLLQQARQMVGELGPCCCGSRRHDSEVLGTRDVQQTPTGHGAAAWSEAATMNVVPVQPQRGRFSELLRGSLETRLLAALDAPGSINKELVSVEDLCECLGTHSWAEQLRVEAIFSRALEHTRLQQEAISLSDSVRLCSRADANVREMEPLVRGLLERVQRWHEEREEMPDGPPVALLGEEEAEEARHHTEPLPLLDDSGGDPRQHSTGQDSPEPEPPSLGPGLSGPTRNELMEQRLERAAKAQADRYTRLEESIARLTQRLEPMLQGGSRDITVDPKRIQRLEEKVQRLMMTLSPVLDLGGPWVTAPKRDRMRRAPTPPRALMGPAADKLPRATTQGTGHDVLFYGSGASTPNGQLSGYDGVYSNPNSMPGMSSGRMAGVAAHSL